MLLNSLDERGVAAVVSSQSLSELLSTARAILRQSSRRHATQRGATLSANGIALTWLAPQECDYATLAWTRSDVEWYLKTFVAKRPRNDPLRVPQNGELVFPYTYAARSRYWDGGWGHLSVLLDAARRHDISFDEACRSKRYFVDAIATLAEHLHLQTVLGLCALFPPPTLAHFLAHADIVSAMASSWRRDTLIDAIRDVADNPHSRRAVVPSLSYPHFEEALAPQMGKPPYQLFQLLPSDVNTPIDTIHEHRSLDVVGGAPLDFAHDLAWATLASRHLNRPIGNITIIAHNLHEYDGLDVAPLGAAHGHESIERWLCRVTDGYRTGRGIPRQLLQEPAYKANVHRLHLKLRAWVRGG